MNFNDISFLQFYSFAYAKILENIILNTRFVCTITMTHNNDSGTGLVTSILDVFASIDRTVSQGFWLRDHGIFTSIFLNLRVVHFGMTQTLFRDYCQQYSINRRISKGTQINFSPVLFESNEKMKYIHKNSGPPT